MQAELRKTGRQTRRTTTIGLLVLTSWALVVSHRDFIPAANADDEPSQISLTPEIRDRVLTVLRGALKSDEFWPSMHAAEALTLAGHGDEVREYLAPRVADEQDDQHRCGLARELVRAGDRSQAAWMLDILAAVDSYGHTHACESLYKVFEIGDGRLIRQTLEQTDDSKCRLMAAAALRQPFGHGVFAA